MRSFQFERQTIQIENNKIFEKLQNRFSLRNYLVSPNDTIDFHDTIIVVQIII